MALSTALALEAVRTRLEGVPGWPASVYRNRGRLALWRDATGGAAGQVVANVLDGNPNQIGHTASDQRPEIEFDQALTLEFLVNEPDDLARETALDLARAAVLDALMPRPGPGEPRERTLGGLCAGIDIEASRRSGVAQDATPGVAGFHIRLVLNMSAESLFGVSLGDGVNVTADDAVMTAAGALLIRGVGVLVAEDAAATGAGASVAPPLTGAAGTQADDAILTATGLLALSGTLTITADDAVMTAAGVISIPGAGSASIIAQDATAAGAGVLAIVGAVTIIADDAVSLATGTVKNTGTVSVVADDAAASPTGELVIAGVVSAIADDAVMTASGALAVVASVSMQAEDATLLAAGTLALAASVSVQADDAVMLAAGAMQATASGIVSVIADDAVMSAAGALEISGAVSVQAEDAAASPTGELAIAGVVSVIAEDATLLAAGDLIVSGAVSGTADDAVMTAAGVLTPPASTGASVPWSLTLKGGGNIDWAAEDLAVDDVIFFMTSGGFGVASPDMTAVATHGFTKLFSTGNSQKSLSVAYRIVDASNITSQTIANENNGKAASICFAVRGLELSQLASSLDGSGLPEITDTALRLYNDGSIPLDGPAITPPSADSLVLSLGVIRKEEAITPPAGYTLINQIIDSSGEKQTLSVAFKNVASAASEDPAAWGGSSGGTQARSLTAAFDAA